MLDKEGIRHRSSNFSRPNMCLPYKRAELQIPCLQDTNVLLHNASSSETFRSMGKPNPLRKAYTMISKNPSAHYMFPLDIFLVEHFPPCNTSQLGSCSIANWYKGRCVYRCKFLRGRGRLHNSSFQQDNSIHKDRQLPKLMMLLHNNSLERIAYSCLDSSCRTGHCRTQPDKVYQRRCRDHSNSQAHI